MAIGSSFQPDIAISESARLNSDQVNYLIWRCVVILEGEIMRDCTDCLLKISARIRQAKQLPLLVWLLTSAQDMEKRQ